MSAVTAIFGFQTKKIVKNCEKKAKCYVTLFQVLQIVEASYSEPV